MMALLANSRWRIRQRVLMVMWYGVNEGGIFTTVSNRPRALKDAHRYPSQVPCGSRAVAPRGGNGSGAVGVSQHGVALVHVFEDDFAAIAFVAKETSDYRASMEDLTPPIDRHRLADVGDVMR